MITYDLPVTIKDIIDAQKTIRGHVYKTGMPKSNYLSEKCNGTIHLKFENMQRTGSFKHQKKEHRASLPAQPVTMLRAFLYPVLC